MFDIRYGEPSMDADDYDYYASLGELRKFHLATLATVRKVLVDGELPRDVAATEGITVQAVYSATKRVLDAIDAVHDENPGELELLEAWIPAARRQEACALIALIGGKTST